MPGSYVFPADDTPDSPWPIFERVLDFPELELQAQLAREHEVRWAFGFRYDTSDGGWTKGEKRVLGTAQMPRVTGALADLFDQLLGDVLGFEPDFLIVLNGDWWMQANDTERETLVVHELLHCGQALDQFGAPKFRRSDNRPILAMLAHSVEEFEAVVRRYGAWKSDLRDFLAAAAEGPVRDNGGPDGGFEDAMAAIGEVLDDLAAKGITMSVGVPLVDAELPPAVPHVDAQLDRDNPPQDKSPADLF